MEGHFRSSKFQRKLRLELSSRRPLLRRVVYGRDAAACERRGNHGSGLEAQRLKRHELEGRKLGVPGFETAGEATRKLKENADEQQHRRIAELERLVARQVLELDFFKGALLRIQENRRKRGKDFRQAVYEQIRHVDGRQGELTIERMCILAAVSRASYYRFGVPGADVDK